MVVQFDRVRLRFPGQAQDTLKSLSFGISEGSFCGLIGPSGSGKTTVLRLINGILKATEGTVTALGEDVGACNARELMSLRRRLGFSVQGSGLFPHLSIEENMGLVAHALGWTKGEIRSRVLELLDMVHLPATVMRQYPDQLSGGQKSRIDLARALFLKPKLLLMDESFGALDPITRRELALDVRSLQDQFKFTAVLVTHDMSEALQMCSDLILIGDGEIVQRGAPQEFLTNPVDHRVRSFLREQTLAGQLSVMSLGLYTRDQKGIASADAPSLKDTESLLEAMQIFLQDSRIQQVEIKNQNGDPVGSVHREDLLK